MCDRGLKDPLARPKAAESCGGGASAIAGKTEIEENGNEQKGQDIGGTAIGII